MFHLQLLQQILQTRHKDAKIAIKITSRDRILQKNSLSLKQAVSDIF